MPKSCEDVVDLAGQPSKDTGPVVKRLIPFICALAAILVSCSGLTGHSSAGDEFRKGATAQNGRQYAEAIKHYSAALSADQDYVNAYIQRAQCYSALGDHAAAVADYEQVVRRNDDGVSYLTLGDAQMAGGHTQLARQAYSSASQRLPHTLGNLSMLAERMNGAHDPSAAAKFLEEALRQTPNSWQLWAQLGQVQFAGGATDDAVGSYATAIEHAPASALSELYAARGDVLLATGQLTQAIEDYQAAVRIDAGDSRAFTALARTYQQQRRWSDAQSAYKSALQANPNDIQAYLGLGALQEQLGDTDAAKSTYEKSLLYVTSDSARAEIAARIKGLKTGRRSDGRG